MSDSSSVMQRRPRQDPVSCQLCRSKKLKCNREYPCSNCIARGATCRPANGASLAASIIDKSSSSHDILQRLERLEAVVFHDASFSGASNGNNSKFKDQQHDGLPTPHSLGKVTDVEDRIRDQDTRDLEDVGMCDSTLLLSLSGTMLYEVSSVPILLERASVPGAPIIVPLPEYSRALDLLHHYSINVDHTARILHLPTVRKMLDTVYATLQTGHSPASSQAALLLAVFTMSAYFSLPINTYLFAKDDCEALQLARTWGKGSLDALDFSRRTTSGSLEDAQASILMAFILYHFDGLSARGRQLMTNAVSIGRDLRLHRIDEWDLPDTDFTPQQRLDREVKRRVWWHMASSDWALSSFSGPQEGAYLIHTNHMRVRMPNECSDEELSDGQSSTDVPAPAQQYFLQRIKLGCLCREIIDAFPIGSRAQNVDYQKVKMIDRRLLQFLEELPPVLKINHSSHYSLKLTDETEATIIGLRFYVNTSTHGRRCKLHQPFLIRQSLDPRFAYSRKACLESARTVFRLQQELDQRVPFPNPCQPQRLGTKTHFMQLATIVMVMDLCFNKNEIDERERKSEVRAALDVFEQAAEGSRLTRIVLNSLLKMLEKYGVQLPASAPSSTMQRNGASASHSSSVSQSIPDSVTNSGSQGYTVPPIPATCHPSIESVQSMTSASNDLLMDEVSVPLANPRFEEFWQSAFQPSMDETMQWDALFADLDDRII